MKRYPIFLFIILVLMGCSGKSATGGQTDADSVHINKDTVPVRKGLYLNIAQKEKHLPRPKVDSLTIEIVNHSDSFCLGGRDYQIERKINGKWVLFPQCGSWRGPDGKMYSYSITDMGYRISPGYSKKLTIFLYPAKPFTPGEYRIAFSVRFQKDKPYEGGPPFLIYDNFFIRE